MYYTMIKLRNPKEFLMIQVHLFGILGSLRGLGPKSQEDLFVD